MIFETLRDINMEEASAGAGSTTGHKCTHDTHTYKTRTQTVTTKKTKLRTIFY